MNNRKMKSSLLLLFTALLFSSCEKEEENYLHGLGLIYADVYGDNARIQGHLSSKGTYPIAEKGIIIGKENDISLSKYLKKEYSSTGSYETSEPIQALFTDLDINTTYYARAFVVDSKGQTSYSGTEYFLTACTDVDSILPRKASDNTTIYIYGKNFGTDPSKITIYFKTQNQTRNAYFNKVVTDNMISVTFNPSGYVPDFTKGDEITVSISKSECSNYESISYLKGSFVYE